MPESRIDLCRKSRLLGVLLCAMIVWPGGSACSEVYSDQNVLEYSFEGSSQGAEGGLGLALINQVADPLLSPDGREVISLGLQDCIERALKYNYDIRVGSYGPSIQMTEVVQAEAAFDAVLFATAQYDDTDRGNNTSEFTTRDIITSTGTETIRIPSDPYRRAHDYNYSLGLRQRLPTGATLQAAQLLRRFRNITDEDALYYRTFYEYDLQLEFRQPLLRDFGLYVNRASISAARNNYGISRQQFYLDVISTVLSVEQNYWQLWLARQQAKVFEGLLSEAKVTLSKLEIRRRQDANTEVVMQTTALMDRATAGIVSSLSRIRQQQDLLLDSMNDPCLPLGAPWEIVPLDYPTVRRYAVDVDKARDYALQRRPEKIAQVLRLANAGLAIGVAKNQVLPRLDLVLQQDNTGPGRTNSGAWDEQWDHDLVSHSVGLNFEVPIGNRAATASLMRARQQQRQEEARLAGLQEQILAEVNIAVHRVRDTFEEIGARKLSAQAETDTLARGLPGDGQSRARHHPRSLGSKNPSPRTRGLRPLDPR